MLLSIWLFQTLCHMSVFYHVKRPTGLIIAVLVEAKPSYMYLLGATTIMKVPTERVLPSKYKNRLNCLFCLRNFHDFRANDEKMIWRKFEIALFLNCSSQTMIHFFCVCLHGNSFFNLSFYFESSHLPSLLPSKNI